MTRMETVSRRVAALLLAALLCLGTLPVRASAFGGGGPAPGDRFTIGVEAELPEGLELVTARRDYAWETDEVSVDIRVGGVAVPEGLSVPEGLFTDVSDMDGFQVVMEAGAGTPDVELRVTESSLGSEEYETVAGQAGESYDEVYDAVGLRYEFYCNGRKLDMSGCQVSVKAEYKREAVGQVLEGLAEEGAGVTPVSVTAYAMQDGSGAVAVDSVEVSAGGAAVPASVELAYDAVVAREPAAGTARDGGKQVVGQQDGDSWIVVNEMGMWLVIGSGKNPEYTVEYFAWLPVVDKTGSTLQIIDTTGKKLPKNKQGDTTTPNGNALMGLTLENGSVKTVPEFRRIYQNNNWKYHEAPQAVYIDKVSASKDYELAEVWILKDGHLPSEGVNEATGAFDKEALKAAWAVYTKANMNHYGDHEDLDAKFVNSLSQLKFTSNENDDGLHENPVDPDDHDNTYHVLIQESSVIRLVYEPVKTMVVDSAEQERTRSFGVTFYDYDISDGKTHTGNNEVKFTDGGVTDAYTDGYGINQVTANCFNAVDAAAVATIRSSTVFAFGNANTGTGYSGQTLDDNKLNANNKGTFKGCTFGLAKSLREDGTIEYASGLLVPGLFNESKSTNGKNAYPDGSLVFNQVGNTYTIASVSVKNGEETYTIDNLDSFHHPYSKYTWIWTNDFWPMDKIRNADPWTGDAAVKVKYNGVVSGTYPASDDMKAHNNMFGMHYTVDFTLTEDYVGPLEYLFFGDDDMWVFLSPVDDAGKISGTGTLVCDIGGVHSSVGEYVNLWDYIGKGTSGRYRLSFFYTERGLSGSTCYMQFTLPSVSQVYDPLTVGDHSGQVTVSKQIGYVNQDGGSYTLGEADEVYSKDETPFEFVLAFQDADGRPLMTTKDPYPWVKTLADGTTETGTLVAMILTPNGDGPSREYTGLSVSLKRGESVAVRNLPKGTRYAIVESDPYYYAPDVLTGGLLTPDGFTPDSADAKVELMADTSTVSGVIDGKKNITYVNRPVDRFRLPKTGGPGVRVYAGPGLAAVLLSGLFLAGRRRRG